MRDIITVAKNELRNLFNSKATILTVVIIPLITVLLGAILTFTMTQEIIAQQIDFTADGYVINAPDIYKADLEKLGVVEADADELEDIKTAITKGKVDVLVVFPVDFELSEDESSMCDIEIWYNSSQTNSAYAFQYVTGVLDSARPDVFAVNADESVNYDLIQDGDFFNLLLSQFYPLYALITMLSSIVTFAAVIVMTDKEKGFMNMFLIAPIKRTHLALGKFAALFTLCSISAASILVGTIGTAIIFPLMYAGESVSFSFMSYVQIFLSILSVGTAVAGIGFLSSTFAKTTNQATLPGMAVSAIVSFGATFTMIPSVGDFVDKIASFVYFVPVLNISFCLKDIVSSSASWGNILISFALNVALGIVLVLVAAKKFDDEKVMQL